ncbi:hypothetical protein H8356DRAFT_948253 [Neocallimastix lanati (nom. inval.)]|uniref:CBM10 domain-containing protein n=1 Tax=Neocallimastix californiae TaxID=1754190 RepID=A0A1Y1ZHF6_9FUNG|nr:hypothetical protein H8356DRAFT_948253 [Neocallimastix sp. JGI-2020a]ORY09624.1 hypothetical protein LY90DRAFT_638214 [Neocallimastix californiae]|eukprot:ORY09624.1 hypothetical protein LY90DRAFT_638214 [Neocallimastix californiae]
MKCFLINEVRGYILILKVKPNRFNIKFYPGYSTHNFIPTLLESYRNDYLTCSSIFTDLGYECCNQTPQVEYSDIIGNLGIENGKICGIGYERGSWNMIVYPCHNDYFHLKFDNNH